MIPNNSAMDESMIESETPGGDGPSQLVIEVPVELQAGVGPKNPVCTCPPGCCGGQCVIITCW
jgi:hypothetical protein